MIQPTGQMSLGNGNIYLNDAPVGKPVRLLHIQSGHALRHRLAALGMLPNTQVTVLSNQGHGQLIVNVKNTKVVLGRGMAHKILVRVEP
ncbi:MAG: ferrous iron transport protein A [Sedimentisphaerales bacterium]|nr:ferrous iron transport protein A [Sedimentisphaerales bacterium]